MWILETDGDVFQGKRLWLRPGKRFLFGRTRSADSSDEFVVSDKTISRIHLLVEVSAVGSADCGQPHSRSTVTITDQATKIGTTLNGVQIRGTKENKVGHTLDKDVNVIILGRYNKEFRISWKPIVFTFSYTSKEHKSNPYQALYGRLGPLDVKVLVEYETLHTTHVAARKRNTAKGLQALIDGRYIVNNETYIEALVQAATSDSGPSLLESDFDANFPKELDYLPPRGDEPTTRDATAYAPNPARKGMFEGYTFVFYEQRQFNNLMAPITQGGGKALCHIVTPGKTEVLDFAQYVKNVAGEKGLGEFEDGGVGKGVVVVRFNPVKDSIEWFKEFNHEVSLQLDHRFVEQNEFLDAILGADASVLRRPLDVVDASGDRAPTPSLSSNKDTQQYTNPQENGPSSTAPEPSSSSAMAPPDPPPTRARGRRGGFKFKGFEDDDDNFSSLPTSSLQASQSFDGPPSSAVAPQDAGSQGLFVSQNTQVESNNGRQRTPTPPPASIRPSRKRTAPVDDPFIDSIAPTAAAIKRRKIAEESARQLRGEVTPEPVTSTTVKVEPKKETQSPLPKSKAKRNGLTKEDDEAIEAARLKAEEAANAKREALEIALDGIPISAMNDLAIIETMPVGRSHPGPARSSRADDSARWDDRWNGRKNFKKFRRRGGEDGAGAPRIRKVIVRLEEAKTRDYGIGDDYWLENSGRDKESRESQRKTKKSTSQRDSQARGNDPRSNHQEEREQVLQNEDKELEVEDHEDDENMDVDDELALAASKLPKSNKNTKSSSSSLSRRNEPITIPSSSPPPREESQPIIIPASTSTRSSRSQNSASTFTTSTNPKSQTQTQTQSRSTASSSSVIPAKRPASKAAGAKKGGGMGFGFRRGAAGGDGNGSGKEKEKEVESDDSEDSDDDGLAFKFKRKKR